MRRKRKRKRRRKRREGDLASEGSVAVKEHRHHLPASKLHIRLYWGGGGVQTPVDRGRSTKSCR